MATFTLTKPTDRTRTRRSLRVVSVCLLVFAVILSILVYMGVLGGNVRTVSEGKVYRSAQLTGHSVQSRIAAWSGAGLETVLQERQIKTVINLRGGSTKDDWFREESAACKSAGAEQVTLRMSALRYPPPDELKKLLFTFDHAAYPILFHCQGGADRSGLTGAIYLHLYENVPLQSALHRELTWRYGHISWGKAHAMDDFFALYNRTGHGLGLREWIVTKYSGLYEQLPISEREGGKDLSPAGS